MQIAMCITSYHPIVGGAERQLAQVARRMIAAGHDVQVITRHHPGLKKAEIVDGVSVRRIGVFGPKAACAAMFLMGATAALAKLKPDVIHCHGLFTPTTAGLLAGAWLGAPVVAKPMRGGETDIIARKLFGPARLNVIARCVSGFAAVSREIEADLADIGVPSKAIHTIPNGVDTELFKPTTRDAGEGGLRFAFAGRMTAQKSVPVLTKAWARVALDVPQARLMVAEAKRLGLPSADETAVRNELAALPGCEMLGHVHNMPDFFAHSDALVLPSASEGLSNALLEAGAAGLGVVATAVGGTTDVIEDGRNGFLVPPDDPDALADALTLMARKPEMCRAMGAAFRETVEAHYSIDATVTKLLDLYAHIRVNRLGLPAAD